MRKRIRIAALLCGVLILLSTSNIYAHPGGTDGAGGHTNHSTGDYHYHHGYSAHSHYDMDGDGDVDCPYNFNDMSGSNSGVIYEGKYTDDSNKNDNENKRRDAVIKVAIGIAVVGFWISPIFFDSKRK